MKHLSLGDVVGIGLSWLGAATISYITNDNFVRLICVAAAYYLAKYIVLGNDYENDDEDEKDETES